jgi:hypothetical protein
MKDINDLINGIKGQDELMSMEDVGKLTSNTKIGTSGYAWSKLALLAVAFFAIISTTVVLWPNGKSENKTVLETPIVNDTETIGIAEDLITKEADSPAQNLMVESQSTREMGNGSGIINSKNRPRQSINNPRTTASKKATGDIESTQQPINLNTAKQTTLDTTNEQIVLTKINTVRNNANEEAIDKESAKNQEDGRSIYPDSEKFYYESWSKEPQSYKVNLAKSNVLKGKEGTIVIIPPGAICGTYESFSANVELTEYYSREDMVNGQLTTASHGDMLESAGMIELRASANGKPLKLCKEVTILFPSAKYQDTGYIGFNGVWDDNHNTIDWAEIDGSNSNFFGGIATPNCDRPTYQAIRSKWPTQKNELKKKGKSNLRKAYRNDEVIRKIRKRFWFQDSITSKLYDEVYDGIKYRMSDTLSASAYNACIVSRAKALALQNFLDSLRGGGEILFDPNILNQQTGYILASVSNLGMINCDRFTNYKDTRNYTYKVGESDGEVSSRLIFRDFNAMLPGKTKNKSYVQFSKIPTGERATLLVIKYLDDNIQIAYDEITIGEEPILNFIVVDKIEVPKVLEAVANGKKYRIDRINQSNSNLAGLDTNKWNRLADSLGAIYLTESQLEAMGIYKHDDVLLFSKTKDYNSHEICLNKEGGHSDSRSGNVRPFKNEVPVTILSKNTMFLGSTNLDKLKTNSDNYFSLLVPFDTEMSKYTLWYFEKNKKIKENLPERILLNNYNAKNVSHYLEVDDSTDENNIDYQPVVEKEYTLNQVVLPDKQLLAKLLITLDSNGIFYQSKGQIGDNNSISLKGYYTESNYGNLRILPKPHDFPPSFFTQNRIPTWPTTVAEFGSINARKLNSSQYFHAHKHDMIAVSLLKPDSSEVVFWYEDTTSVLSLLGNQDAKRVRDYLTSVKTLNVDVMANENTDKVSLFNKMQEFKILKPLAINPIELNNEDLKKLNISEKSGNILYAVEWSSGHIVEFEFTKKNTLTRVTIPDSIQLLKNKKSNTMPAFISDKYGKSYRVNISQDTSLIHFNVSNQSETTANLDRLIPIYVKSNNDYHLSDYFEDYYHPDCIFWYEPTDEFLALLPQDIRKQLTYELALISDATQTPSQLTTENPNDSTPEIESCVYLDPCADIKTNITDMILFPNPTKGIVNVSISLSKSVGGDIKVTNLTGQPFLEKRIEDCSVKSTLDVSNLPAGLYLVTLLSDEGDKLTRRVIRE